MISGEHLVRHNEHTKVRSKMPNLEASSYVKKGLFNKLLASIRRTHSTSNTDKRLPLNGSSALLFCFGIKRHSRLKTQKTS